MTGPDPDEPARPDDSTPDDPVPDDPVPDAPGADGRGPHAEPPAADPSPAEPGAGPSPAGAAPARPDPDAAFRAIVEGFSRPAAGPVPPWPVEEDVEPTPPRRTARPPQAGRPPRAEPPAAGLPGWVEPDALADEHHFVPPPPPPAPRLKPRTLAASAAVLLGVVLMFAPSLLNVAPGASTSFLGLVLAAGGAGALVYWMRDAPGVDDGPDDGAVV